MNNVKLSKLTTGVFLLFTVNIACAKSPEWLDPEVFQVNKEPVRSSFYAYTDKNDINLTTPYQADNYQLLNGQWKFNWVNLRDERPKDFYQVDFDDSGWIDFPVPANWQMNSENKRFGIANYLNHPCTVPKVTPPATPDASTPVGSYRKEFTIPASWGDRQQYIHLAGVNSAYYIWVNGKKVGYAEDTKTGSDFDITPYTKVGKNTVALEVHRFSDATYFECQDMWRVSGIERDVFVYSTPKTHIKDYFVDSTLTDDYKHGVFNFSAKIKNNATSAKSAYKVKVELLDDDNDSVIKKVLDVNPIAANQTSEVTFSKVVKKAKQWSAELPNLYTLNLTLLDDKGMEIEFVEARVGFRRSELKNGTILVNGKPIKFKGVNRHEHDPVSGHVISRESMRKDIEMMKRANVNAIRNSHYPSDPYLYHLADEYGMYILDEANIESHGLGASNQATYNPKKHIVNKPEWTGAYLYRVENMYERSKNHASVVMFSTGNETGDGRNIEAGYDWLKSKGTRPVIVEQAQQRRHTDAYGQMYASVPRVEYYIKNTVTTDQRPLILIEYEHLMGNSGGNLKEYWDLFYSHDSLQGGFIWDWVDQTWALKDEKGQAFWGYGGDIEPEGTRNDASFSANGMVYADRTPYPYYFEVKKVYQNIDIDWHDMEDEEIKVFNKNYFRDLSNRTLRWQLLENGVVVAQDDGFDLDAKPFKSEKVDLDFDYDLKKGAEYFVNLEIVNTKPEGILPAGTLLASEQLAFAKTPKITPKLDVTNDALKVSVNEKVLTVTGDTFAVSFDKNNGSISSLIYHGKEQFLQSSTPDFWRAPTDNDFGDGMPKESLVWHKAAEGIFNNSFTYKMSGQDVIVELEQSIPAVESRQKVTYTVSPSGEIQVNNWFYAAEHKKHPEMPRLGMKFTFDKSMDKVQWYGRGPIENYWDRKEAAYVGLYEATVDELFTPYVRPQESGHRTDVRHVALFNDKGEGVEFVSDYTMGFNASHYDISEFWYKKMKPLRQHPSDLVKSDYVFVNIDHRQRGVGGTDSWRSTPLFDYQILWGDYQYSFRIRPITK
ncbi:glycoside hydrolase family 2 TIM barrel-domain containing protein [Psychrosphaera sp. 1_MG-2023]|uniref:glycoside hydrolase family 2 TIM barrel-domain containing protein n=1 Tax=Psychrosphaera sp. 1_MG-2023 TaxID=3062643 RepID=UPI0026E3F8DE|nr:glycoside hydrolase family 2 TIM barrel-domain containing protein [Psychrosphaera sp. 1_MG-2023]MDO6721323.1 glycoside hydrolase family 2 TIM barrel-domain containing protein [Psychrosphaera sp. 1_MG-2023]